MNRQQRLRQLGIWLLYLLAVIGVVGVLIGGATGRQRVFAAGVWLVSLSILLQLLVSLARPI